MKRLHAAKAIEGWALGSGSFSQPQIGSARQRWASQTLGLVLALFWSALLLLHDRDSKFTDDFDEILKAGGVKPLKLPARSPNLNAFAERWVLSVKSECLSKVILFGEASLRRVLSEFDGHYHGERNHQGKDNEILFPEPVGRRPRDSPIQCRERLDGLLKYYHRSGG